MKFYGTNKRTAVFQGYVSTLRKVENPDGTELIELIIKSPNGNVLKHGYLNPVRILMAASLEEAVAMFNDENV